MESLEKSTKMWNNEDSDQPYGDNQNIVKLDCICDDFNIKCNLCYINMIPRSCLSPKASISFYIHQNWRQNAKTKMIKKF